MDPTSVFYFTDERIPEEPEELPASQGRGVGAVPAGPPGCALEGRFEKGKGFDREPRIGLAGKEEEKKKKSKDRGNRKTPLSGRGVPRGEGEGTGRAHVVPERF
jgi:hypothetical protein